MPPGDAEFRASVAASAEATREILERVEQRVTDQGTTLNEVGHELSSIRQELRQMHQALGTSADRPLPSRVLLLETDVANLKASSASQQDRSWQIWLAVIVAGISVIINVVGYAVEHIK